NFGSPFHPTKPAFTEERKEMQAGKGKKRVKEGETQRRASGCRWKRTGVEASNGGVGGWGGRGGKKRKGGVGGGERKKKRKEEKGKKEKGGGESGIGWKEKK